MLSKGSELSIHLSIFSFVLFPPFWHQGFMHDLLSAGNPSISPQRVEQFVNGAVSTNNTSAWTPSGCAQILQENSGKLYDGGLVFFQQKPHFSGTHRESSKAQTTRNSLATKSHVCPLTRKGLVNSRLTMIRQPRCCPFRHVFRAMQFAVFYRSKTSTATTMARSNWRKWPSKHKCTRTPLQTPAGHLSFRETTAYCTLCISQP